MCGRGKPGAFSKTNGCCAQIMPTVVEELRDVLRTRCTFKDDLDVLWEDLGRPEVKDPAGMLRTPAARGRGPR